MTDDDRVVVDKRSGADDGQRDIYHDGVGKRAPGERFTSAPGGRWPSNVALIHSEGCRPTGVRKIRTQWGQATERTTSPRYTGTAYNAGQVGEGGQEDRPIGYAGPDGTETVAAWTCEPECPVALLDQQSGDKPGGHDQRRFARSDGGYGGGVTGTWRDAEVGYNDRGGASRFFYTAKAGRAERVTIDGEGHPTVKPLALMRWLVRLVTPPGGLVLDMFAGSGTTGEAAMLEGFRSVLVDLDMASCRKAMIRTDPYVRRRGKIRMQEGKPVEEGEADTPRLF